MKKIIMLMPYFGKWPEWINLYVETCKWNPTIDWLFFTDCGEPENKCDNVKYVHMSLDDFNKFTSSKLGIKLHFKNLYKLCDLKGCYGVIFEDYIKDYDYFGWGDIDVVYGNIRKFVTDEILQYDVISFHRERLSSHFCLFKNCLKMRYIHHLIEDWKTKMSVEEWVGFGDELDKLICKKSNYYVKAIDRISRRIRIFLQRHASRLHTLFKKNGKNKN